MIQPLPCPQRIGIIGGGQLGCMLMEEGSRYNLHFTVLDGAEAPGRHIATHFIQGSLLDAEAIAQLAAQSDVITYEIEHINMAGLLQAEASGKTVIPSAAVLQLIQDKGLQKEFYRSRHIPSPDFRLVNSAAEWEAALADMGNPEKFVAKTRNGGYDGKGVAVCGMADRPFDTPCVLEHFVRCHKELSVIVAVDRHGNTACFPPVEMVFDPLLNLVDTLLCPARILPEIAKEATEIATRVATGLESAGLFAVEMFLDENRKLWVNETAPRPHNSGHHTIEACVTSQYEQLIRILCGWPLGNTSQLASAAMINIVGPAGLTGSYTLANTNNLMAMPGVYVHLYGKAETRPGRKLGHITVMADSPELLDQKVSMVKALNTVCAG